MSLPRKAFFNSHLTILDFQETLTQSSFFGNSK